MVEDTGKKQEVPSESDQVQEPPREVNVDELEVRLLILVNKPKSFASAASFLTRRGWPTNVVGSINDLITHIAKDKPDFVLVSYNHTSPSIAKLPLLLAQTFNTTCVGFSELGDAMTMAKLTKSRIPHVLTGQASGPSIHRMVRKILLERYGQGDSDNENSKAYDGLGSGEDRVEIKGSSWNGESMTLKGSANSNSIETIQGSGYNTESVPFYRDKGGSESSVQSGSQVADEEETTPEEEMSEEALLALLSNAKSGAQSAATVGSPNSSKTMPIPANSQSGSESMSLGSADSAQNSQNLSKSPRKLSSYESLLFKAVGTTLDEVCGSERGGYGDLGEIEHVGVIQIDSDELHGYLIMGAGGFDLDINSDFIEDLRKTLMRHFTRHGLTATTEPSFCLQVKKVPFKAWAKEHSVFSMNRKGVGVEIGIAFLETDVRPPIVRACEQRRMAGIDLLHFEAGRKIEFKTYLHLEKNSRFFLYINDGRFLLERQKQNLMQKNVNQLHIHNDDVVNFRKYLVRMLVDDKIASFLKSRFLRSSDRPA